LQNGPEITLEEAADWIIEEDVDNQKLFKSKVRK
jgi:hypothetical protein